MAEMAGMWQKSKVAKSQKPELSNILHFCCKRPASVTVEYDFV